MTKPHANSWNDFWAADAATGGSGCLPEAYQSINSAQETVWCGFSKSLPKSAKLLDMATGDGRVMGWIMRARRDIKATGCDLAPKLPAPPRGTQVKTGVAMENLPFPDGRFGAVTSQFGFEYGEVDKVAAEMARVLRPGGIAGLMMHRGDGPILAHNLARREQIAWVLDKRQLVDAAKRSLKARALSVATIPRELVQAPQEGAARFGATSAAWEIAEAIRQTLTLGMRDHPANVARTLDMIVSKARNELGRIASLEAACKSADDHAVLKNAFAAAGLEQREERTVAETDNAPPFATFRVLKRAD